MATPALLWIERKGLCASLIHDTILAAEGREASQLVHLPVATCYRANAFDSPLISNRVYIRDSGGADPTNRTLDGRGYCPIDDEVYRVDEPPAQ